MIQNTSFNVALVQVSKLYGNVVQIEGYFRGATADRWLQLHDSEVTPAAGAVPIWQIPISQTSQFFQNMQVAPLSCLNGIFVGVSSTEGTWTASADTMDITVFTGEQVKAATIVGDLTIFGRDGLTVWANDAANSSKKLARIQVINGTGAVAYLLFFGTYVPTGTKPLLILPLADTAAVQVFDFGRDGANLVSFRVTTAGVLQYGCYLLLSSTPASFTPVAATSQIQVTYVV